jgi:hypothetical protein
MASAVLATIAHRLEGEGRLRSIDGAPVERPPLARTRLG